MKLCTGVLALVGAAGLSHAFNGIWENAAKFKPVVERAVPGQPFQNERLEARRTSRWATQQTAKFAVNGKNIPEVPFDIGESYAGLLPISGSPHETRELYFWFFPTSNNDSHEVTVWLNGGPGCSSLSGLLEENGPFTWEKGTLAPVKNPYSWNKLTNMLWIEQPVGVGFSQGTPNITNEVELGEQFLGFYKQFAKTFSAEKYDLYLTGESYAGTYIPYIAQSFIDAKNSDIKLKGISINDPSIGEGLVAQYVPIQPYVEYWSQLFYLNDTFRSHLKKAADKCGYTAYINKYLQFPPPKGPFPVPNPDENDDDCDIFSLAANGISDANPCFNIYHITDTCPSPYDQLGIVNDGDYNPPGAVVYFNRTDVQKAINAPVGTDWMQCSENVNVFGGAKNNPGGRDQSLAPSRDGVLQKVIEYTNNTIIGSGNLDFLLSTNGTLMSIQNTTWNGKQGFQSYPNKTFYVPFHKEQGGALGAAGTVGLWGTERGLTFYQVQLAGHEVPGYAPSAGYRMLEVLLGRVKDLSSTISLGV
ncbi:Hypothetical protein R9X50_00141200 [Acrodontium crateriforme]|uniref:Carboxypeptidase n=1 Tax=Acrodontium crateriforme TaxID=150365 RepID=A0AAQ3R865_9PEZI|nr:Hypothetical protein R9X50_00141200 [Acrodontium crateriforme]